MYRYIISAAIAVTSYITVKNYKKPLHKFKENNETFIAFMGTQV